MTPLTHTPTHKTNEFSDDLLSKASSLRLKGNSLPAFDLYNCAKSIFAEKKDFHGVLTALHGRCKCLQDLFSLTEDSLYPYFIKHEAEEMLNVATEQDIKDFYPIIYSYLGKAALFLKDYKGAKERLQQAINLYPSHDSERGEMLTYLGEATYYEGQKNQGKEACSITIESSSNL